MSVSGLNFTMLATGKGSTSFARIKENLVVFKYDSSSISSCIISEVEVLRRDSR
jgi:hypothetical protein